MRGEPGTDTVAAQANSATPKVIFAIANGPGASPRRPVRLLTRREAASLQPVWLPEVAATYRDRRSPPQAGRPPSYSSLCSGAFGVATLA